MDASATEENHTENNVAGAIENSANLKQESVENMGAGAGEKSWPGWPGENVFRILAPSHKVGSIIGRKGEFIKKICEESKARVKILDSRPGAPERMVIISAKEEPDLSISPAMNGLLQVHKRLIDGLDGDSTKGPPNPGNAVLTRLLVGATQAGSLIGKQGSTIKSFQEASGAVVRVVDELPSVALPDDRVVEIQGEPAAVHTALELISNHLRKFLVDRSVLPLFEIQNLQMEHSVQVVQQPQPWSHPQGIRPSAGGYGVGVGVGTGADPQYVPPHPHDSFFRPPELPALEKQPHPGIATYGRDPQSMGGYAAANQQYGREAPPMGSYAAANQQSAAPMVAPVTQHMQIPLSFVNAVVGAAGANISYIRRASGATVMIQETRGVPGEMTVEISGGATQIQTAQQLIQNFMAEAGSAVTAPAQNAIGSADPVYESYQPPQGFYATGSAAAAASGPPYDSYYSY